MKKIQYALIIGLCFFSPIKADFDFFTPVSSDTIFIYLNYSLKSGEKMIVEKASEGNNFKTVTSEGIKGEYDGDKLKRSLGDNYSRLEETLNADNPQLVLVKLRTDPFYGMIFSLLYRDIAKALGRFYSLPGHEKGKDYQYRVKIINREDKILFEKTKTVKAEEIPPQQPENIQTEQLENSIKISWQYPDWKPEEQSPAVQFILYRQKNGKQKTKLSKNVFMRIDGLNYQYYDGDIYPGDRIKYSLCAVDAAGIESPPASLQEIIIKDLIPPPAPSGLSVIKTEKGIELNWNMSLALDAVYYDIFRWEGLSKDSVQINKKPVDVLTPTFLDTSFQINQQYYYAVLTVDSTGNKSRTCNRISIYPTDRTPPPPPENLRAVILETGVKIEWNPSIDSFVKGYYVSRGYDENQNLFKITDSLIMDTVYIDRRISPYELKPGQSYYYAVTAVDSFLFQSKPAGTWLSIPDKTPPQKPGMISLEHEQGTGVRIKWNPSPSLDVSQYKIEKTNNHSLAQVGMVSSLSPLTILDREINHHDKIIYRITAIDTAGNEGAPVFSDTLLILDKNNPPPVKFAEAVMTADGVIIQWEKVTSFDLAGYIVYRSNLPTGKKEKISSVITEKKEFLDVNGTKDNWYSIVSIDSSGNESRPSKPISPYRIKK